MAAIPIAIAGAAVGVPGMVPLLGATPFITGAWFGLTIWRWREPKRRVWFYAFTEGCALLDGPQAGPRLPALERGHRRRRGLDQRLRHQRRGVPAEADGVPAALRGRAKLRDLALLHNVRDPYAGVGPLVTGLMPAAAAATLPKFPTIDQIIAAFAAKPDPRA